MAADNACLPQTQVAWTCGGGTTSGPNEQMKACSGFSFTFGYLNKSKCFQSRI